MQNQDCWFLLPKRPVQAYNNDDDGDDDDDDDDDDDNNGYLERLTRTFPKRLHIV